MEHNAFKFLGRTSLALVLIIGSFFETAAVIAKPKLKDGHDIYRRNSLCTYFISDIDLLVSENGVEDEIREYLDKFKIDEKFDDHTIGNRYVSVKGVSFTDADRAIVDETFAKAKAKAKSGGGFGKFVDNMFKNNEVYQQRMAENKKMIEEADTRQFLNDHPEIFTANSDDEWEENKIKEAAKIYRYLIDTKLANQLIAKWFNAKSQKIDGSYYDLDLIQERGLYNASELDVMKAAESNRKWAVLKDAGMELIPHTFISFTQFEIIDARNYQERRQKTSAHKTASNITGTLFGKTNQEMKELDEDSKALTAGYYITATTFLFQLDWTDATLENFINNYWEADLSKLMNSNEFQIKYLGYQDVMAKTVEDVRGKGLFKQLGSVFKEGVSAGISKTFGHKSDEQINAELRASHEATRKDKTLELTEQSLIRSIDATYANLQKDHEEFKVKAPLQIKEDTNEIYAYIGLKEGVTSKSEFEVLERTFNLKKNIYEYKRVGKLKVNKNRIWDNRYTLIDDGANVVGKGKNAVTIDCTYFSGKSDDFAPGMLLRQIK